MQKRMQAKMKGLWNSVVSSTSEGERPEGHERRSLNAGGSWA